MTGYAHPNYLIEVTELAQRLDEPNLRIFDTAVYLKPQAGGGYEMTSGLESYSQGHIAGAGFIDLIAAWANPDSGLGFTLPELPDLQAAIGASGINSDNEVVLYSSGHLMWATRAWWLLHHAGHDNVRVLNGSLPAWRAADGAIETAEHRYPATNFTATAREGCFADTARMLDTMDGSACTVNALTQALYEGTGDFYYQRRGHIPGSKHLFYDDVLTDQAFASAESLTAALSSRGMLGEQPVITYCGGGIAATVHAFACKLMGKADVAVYDGSMSEWVQDESRPLVTGPNPS